MSTPWPENPKFCKDCKWCDHAYAEFYNCTSPNIKTVNLVTGEGILKPTCEGERSKDGICGIEARYFEPKEQKL